MMENVEKEGTFLGLGPSQILLFPALTLSSKLLPIAALIKNEHDLSKRDE